MTTGPTEAKIDFQAVAERALALSRQLIAIDTSGPPDFEAPAARLVAQRLIEAGLQVEVCEAQPKRTSVVARLPGRRSRGPLLLHGHLDVVPADASSWSHQPFAADLADGYLWGRGALDMKAVVACQVESLIALCELGLEPSGDLIVACVADEENGGDLGAGWLVQNRPDLVTAEYAVGEFGGYTKRFWGRTVYLVQVAEKGLCRMRLSIRGISGHASMPLRGGAVGRLGEALTRLDRQRLPLHRTGAVEVFLKGLAKISDAEVSASLIRLLDAKLGDGVLDAMGSQSRLFEAILRNTAVPTVISASPQINLIPEQVEVIVDGRLLPGQRLADMKAEVADLLGPEVEIAPLQVFDGASAPLGDFYGLLAALLTEMDSDAVVLPYLTPWSTDAKHFARLGATCYGFSPMQLDSASDLISGLHSVDERIPVACLRFCVEGLLRLMLRY